MSTFFSSSYDIEDSSDEEILYYSDDERHQVSLEVAGDSSSDEEELVDSEEESETPKAGKTDSDDYSESDNDEDDDDNESEDWGSSSDSDSDDEAPKGRDYFLKKDFLKGGNDDSDSEDEKKVVKSAKDKYLDEIEALVDQLETFSMVEEWIKLSSELDKLMKLIPKHQQYQIPIPKDYIKVLCLIEDAVANQSKESLKLLSPSQSKNLNIVKQKVKKEVKVYAEQVGKYREDPSAFAIENDDSSNSLNVSDENDQKANADAQGSSSGVFTIVLSILETRGKKNIDHKEQITELELLVKEAKTTYEKITIYMLLLSIRFDLHSKASFMPLDAWTSSFNEVIQLLDLLDSDGEYVITEAASGNEDITSPPAKDSEGRRKIVGSIASLIERLADELNSHLLHIDPNSNEYITRLKDESKVYSLIVRGQVYYSRILSTKALGELEGDQLTRLIIRRLDFIYYKPINLIVLSELNAWNLLSIENCESVAKITSNEADVQSTNELIDLLCAHVYEYSNHGSGSQRKRAALMQSYYYAACDQFYRAREILHLTHVQAVVQSAEVSIQVLFNRAVAQLGLAAFRNGQIEEARSILTEVATSARIREVLGQSINRGGSSQTVQALTADGETITIGGERHVPFHMHINIQLLETVYYITSVLIEIPLMALGCYQGTIGDNQELLIQLQQSKRTGGSKTFRRVLEYAVRQYFRGPAEDARDSVILAALEFIKGDWKNVMERFRELNIWGMMPGLELTPEDKANKIMKMLEDTVKKSTLRTWIYCESGILKSYPINRLSARFELDADEVTSIVAGIISKEEVNATLQFKSNNETYVVFHAKNRGMNEIIKNFADKINSVVERNEKLSLGGYQVMLKKK